MSDNAQSENNLDIRGMFRALKSRNYKLFFLGQGISLVGTWIQLIAVDWLVYSMTHSALLLGIVAFASQIATFILSPFAGVFVDRLNRHRILVVTQTLFMLQTLTLSFLVFSGRIAVWQIIALGMFSGFVSGFDIPTRQAFVVELVEDRADLSNAIALNSSMFNAA